MGLTLCGFGQASPQRLPKEDSLGIDRRSSLTTSVIEFMKLKCLRTSDKKKRKLNPQEEKQQKLLENTGELSTLEDWLSASPGLNLVCNNGGDFHVFKESSNRVYPSSATGHVLMPTKLREGLSMERLVLKKGEAEKEAIEGGSLSRSQSGKTKKRVSFRFPEVADIMIFDLSDECYED